MKRVTRRTSKRKEEGRGCKSGKGWVWELAGTNGRATFRPCTSLPGSSYTGGNNQPIQKVSIWIP